MTENNNENAHKDINVNSEENADNNYDEIEEHEGAIEDSLASLMYGTRVRELVKKVAGHEGVPVQVGKKGVSGLQNALKFLAVMLVYESLDVLKEKSRVQITSTIINEALTNMIGKSDALNIATLELEKLINTLQLNNNNTSVLKATDFVNLFEREEIEEKNKIN